MQQLQELNKRIKKTAQTKRVFSQQRLQKEIGNQALGYETTQVSEECLQDLCSAL